MDWNGALHKDQALCPMAKVPFSPLMNCQRYLDGLLLGIRVLSFYSWDWQPVEKLSSYWDVFVSTLHAAAIFTFFFVPSLMAAGPAHTELDELSAERLAVLGATPIMAGELIYRGDALAQKGSGPEPSPLFRYERRLNTIPSGFEATHLTRDPGQQLVIVESAQFTAEYRLQRFAVQNQQLDYKGMVHVSSDGRRLRYSLNNKGVVSTAEEQISAPAVSGPSLFGFILEHGSELAAGKTIPVRFIVMNEKQTYGLDIRQESATKEHVVYSIAASSWLIRPLVATMRATFDSASKTWVRYEGRVPPKQTLAGKLADLDARVEYTAVATVYR